jgi:hypothetical protein
MRVSNLFNASNSTASHNGRPPGRRHDGCMVGIGDAMSHSYGQSHNQLKNTS